MDRTSTESKTPPWQQPLLSQRRCIRADGRLGELKGAWVNRKAVQPGDASLAMHLSQRGDRGGSAYSRWQRMQKQPGRGDAADWRWSKSAELNIGGAGNQRVGPGWGDASRLDAGEIEVIVDGVRCSQIDGAWVTAEGHPCPEQV